jgi:hypothetical protein
VFFVVLLSTLAAPGGADRPAFSPNDIPTLFFISKSDDRNRVDYGIRLDGNCLPQGAAAVFPYWREFENAPPVRIHPMPWFEHAAYGISEQRLLRRTAKGAEYRVCLRQLPRELTVVTNKGTDGRCGAVVHTTISGMAGAELLSAYVKLRRFFSAEYVEIHGRNPLTGAAIDEKVRR